MLHSRKLLPERWACAVDTWVRSRPVATARGRRSRLYGKAIPASGPPTATIDSVGQTGQRSDGVLREVIARIDAQHLFEARSAIDPAVAVPGMDAPKRKALLTGRERMCRILPDVPLDASAPRAARRRQVREFSKDAFERWQQAGLFESMRSDGERRCSVPAPSNLFGLSAEASVRCATSRRFNNSQLQLAHKAHPAEAREHAPARPGRNIVRRRVRVNRSLHVVRIRRRHRLAFAALYATRPPLDFQSTGVSALAAAARWPPFFAAALQCGFRPQEFDTHVTSMLSRTPLRGAAPHRHGRRAGACSFSTTGPYSPGEFHA